jgi:ABC-type uncharacterized transport system involved in gliding motility auxiliary subunit
MNNETKSSQGMLSITGRWGSGIAILLVVGISINVIASKIYTRFDVTQDRVFSLSEGTRKILEKLDRNITMRLYFSRSSKELPPVIKTYATRVEELLYQYRALSKGKINVEILDPKPDSDEEEWAAKYGINPIRLASGDPIYFGVFATSGSTEIVIPYLDPRREEFLEYDISEILVKMGKKAQPKIGLLTSLPIEEEATMAQRENKDWSFYSELKRLYEIQNLPLKTEQIPSDLTALLIIHPKDFSQSLLYAIDQYALSGGRILLALDPMSRADLYQNAAQMRLSGQMPRVSSNLDPLLKAWSIEYSADDLIGDLALSSQINAGGQIITYPYFLGLNQQHFTKESIITSSLKHMVYGEGGNISPSKDAKIIFEPLIKTGSETVVVPSQEVLFLPPQELAKKFKKIGEYRTLAAVVRGQFKSAFSQKPPRESTPDKSSPDEKSPENNQSHLSEGSKETTIVAIADVDFLSDTQAFDKFMFGPQMLLRPRNDNMSFLLNSLDYLTGSDDLISIRAKGRVSRPFEKVQELQLQAQKKWQNEEESLSAQLAELEKKLAELQKNRTDNNRFSLNQAQQDEISRFREEERKIRVKRRMVRKNLREDIEDLGHLLTAANLLIMPSICSLFGTAVFIRRHRSKKGKHHG